MTELSNRKRKDFFMKKYLIPLIIEDSVVENYKDRSYQRIICEWCGVKVREFKVRRDVKDFFKLGCFTYGM